MLPALLSLSSTGTDTVADRESEPLGLMSRREAVPFLLGLRASALPMAVLCSAVRQRPLASEAIAIPVDAIRAAANSVVQRR